MKEFIWIGEEEGTLTVRPVCEIDHHTSRIMRELIDKRIFEAKPKELLLDFSSVGFMDSSGIGLIIGRCSVCESIGAYVRLCGLSDNIRKLVRLCGVEKIKNLSVDPMGAMVRERKEHL